jgi:hypothetical protein
MRVVKNELPNVPSRVIDLPARPELHHLAELIHEVITVRHDLDESEVALRGERLVRKLTAVRKEAAEANGAVDLPGVGRNDGRYGGQEQQHGGNEVPRGLAKHESFHPFGSRCVVNAVAGVSLTADRNSLCYGNSFSRSR